MSSDARRLARLSLKDHSGKVHRLHPELCRPKGRFCDESGTLSAHGIRVFYMMAGILPPQSDAAEDLFASIQQNIMFLNAYLEHAGLISKRPTKKPVAALGATPSSTTSGGTTSGGTASVARPTKKLAVEV
jgi:hypothetical protein